MGAIQLERKDNGYSNILVRIYHHRLHRRMDHRKMMLFDRLYIIINPKKPSLAWSRKDGWNSRSREIFTYIERRTMTLPENGEWRILKL